VNLGHLRSGLERVLEEITSFRRADILELASFLEDHLPSADIDDKSYGDNEPYWTIENRDTQGVPWVGNPAPQLRRVNTKKLFDALLLFCDTYYRRAIHLSLFLCFDEEVCEGWDEGQAIADEEVFPFKSPQLRRIVLVEEG